MAKWLWIFSALILFSSTNVSAQAVTQDTKFQTAFDAGVSALQSGDYERGLSELKAAERAKRDPRVPYYIGFALEKLQRCDSAKARYQSVAKGNGPSVLRKTATDALQGFDERCVEKTTEAPAQRMGGARVAFLTLGTLVTIVGVLGLIAVPIKTTIDREASNDVESYFSIRYGCDVDFGVLNSTSSCDEPGLLQDDVYGPYSEEVDRAKTANKILLFSSIGVTTVGVALLLGAIFSKPEVAISPNGAGVGFAF